MQSLDAHQVSKNLGGDEGLNLSLRDIQLVLATSKYPEDKAFKLCARYVGRLSCNEFITIKRENSKHLYWLPGKFSTIFSKTEKILL